MDAAHTLPQLLTWAWLLPLASFTLIVFFGPRMGKHGVGAGWVATAAIGTSCVLSLYALFGVWIPTHGGVPPEHHGAHEDAQVAAYADHLVIVRAQNGDHETIDAKGHAADEHAADEHGEHAAVAAPSYSGDWYALGQFSYLRVTLGYYIDALTVLMFAMVTFIATCIHVYATGYMHDELHDITDHEVTLSDGHHLHRHGRFHRFFQYLSLFCFSMLGIVIAGNIAMVFVFWELVGICSYFLIGFYIERKSASTAANKAFIVNRVGDFGMIVGLMALFGALGTFSFGDWKDDDGAMKPGLFSLVRPPELHHRLRTPDGMVKAMAADEIAVIVRDHMAEEGGTSAGAASEIQARIPEWRTRIEPGGIGHSAYWLLVVAGLGIFCGCVGKSAQFPLHVWLPDAMEGPTPVSALVHSATMVAAGVYLVGRFYPVFTPEVLLVIAIIGCITLFLAASIAITATDIKRVLAYSTVSQLGYMMLALGLGGWVAGMFHLITHAFFKSLLFMCSGSVIHACHTNEMPKMGGLRKKMPYTAYTMLVGCLAIAGAGIPFVVGLSGYYSKDAILAQAMSFKELNPLHTGLFVVAASGAAITSFYMFRLWYMTFAGEPRDHHIYDHAHESPKVMYLPLVVLAVLAATVGWSTRDPLPLTQNEYGVRALLMQAQPAGTAEAMQGVLLSKLSYPAEAAAHDFHHAATVVAFSTALLGIALATVFYGWPLLNPAEVRHQFSLVYKLLIEKWYFDEIYQAIFINPIMFVARRVAEFDKKVIDGFINNLAIAARMIARLDDLTDRYIVDGLVNGLAERTYALGLSLRSVQTGQVRQYVLFIVVGTVALFALASFLLDYTLAGP